MQHAGYSQKSSMKIVRTVHRVTFRNNNTAAEMVKWFQAVPQKARIVDFDGGDIEEGELPYIEFELESEPKENLNDQ
jgi:hypothetical protein